MDFADDQKRAFAAAAALLADQGVDLTAGETAPAAAQRQDGKARMLVILGRAGSGKTRLLAHLVERLEAAGAEVLSPDFECRRRGDARRFAVLAPTNKAASVLRAQGVAATTLHRVLYIPVYDPMYEAIAEWLAKPGSAAAPQVEGVTVQMLERARAFFAEQKSIPGALAAAGLRGSDFIAGWKRRDEPLDIALVDESSMLDDRQLKDLSEIFNTLILFGDPAQLAPVGSTAGQGTAGSGGTMIFDNLPGEQVVRLEQVHRQAVGNPILDLAHALCDPDLEFGDFERMIEAAARRDERIVVSPRVDAGLMARSPVLVWRNATRVRLIAAFRTAHGLSPFALTPGEPLICDGIELPLKHRKKRADLEARGLVKGAQVIYLGLGAKRGFSRLWVTGAEAPRVKAATIIKIESPDSEEPFIASAARMGAAFLHGAACTVHKAQGSQWPVVQIFAPDLYAAARSGRVEAGIALWKRLAYVAVTRAEEQLIWVTRYMISKPQAPLEVDDLASSVVRCP